MHDAIPSNANVGRSFGILVPVLMERYGRSSDCSRAQVDNATNELTVWADIAPYIYAAFLSDDETTNLKVDVPFVCRDEVDRRSERSVRDLVRAETPDAGFYERGRV